MEEEEKVNLSKFQRHQRSFPWALIRKIAMAIIIIGLVWYASKVISEKKEKEGIELDIQD